jgi:DNA-binding LacI/PurR family transcriptional regulator
MASEKVTSVDVAKRAGVSQSAVSRVFTPGASASKATIEKVRRAAAELGYRPNVLARSLITGRSRIIGLVVAYLDNYFYPEMVERLSVALQQKGYHVLVFMASPTVGNIETVLQEILDYQVDGIVLASVSMSSILAAECAALGIPVVLFNRDQDDDRLSSVTTDNRAGGRAIAEHLIALGRERLAYIAGFEGASTQRDRERGFRDGLEAAGRDLYAHGVGNFQHPQARDAALRMFDRPAPPDAVFVANDHMAFAVMDVLRFELGLKVPGDVAVVGFDDVPLAAWRAYDLTTFRQRVNRMVAETVTTLIDHIDGGATEPRRVAVDGILIERGSTRRPETSRT